MVADVMGMARAWTPAFYVRQARSVLAVKVRTCIYMYMYMYNAYYVNHMPIYMYA